MRTRCWFSWSDSQSGIGLLKSLVIAQLFNLYPHAFQNYVFSFAIKPNLLYAIISKARAGNNHFIDSLGSANRAQRPVSPKDAQTVYDFSFLHRIVIYESHRNIT